MPQQICWIVGNVNLRFCVCYAPIYTELSELDTHILWATVRVKDFRDAMLCKHLFQQ